MTEIRDTSLPPSELDTQPVTQVPVATVDQNGMASSSTIAAAQSDFAIQDKVEIASWNSLPVELQTEVLAAHLVFPRAITSIEHEVWSKHVNLTNIMLTSKEMHHLAASVYYGWNTFVIMTGRPFFHFYETRNSPWHAHADFKVPNPSVGKLVRRLEVHVKLGALLPPRSYRHQHPRLPVRMPEELRYEAGLLCLVEPLEGSNGWREHRWSEDARSRFVPSAGWQYSFPAVKHLKIVIDGRRCLSPLLTFDNREINAFKQLPQYARIPLQPLEVQVETEKHLVFGFGNACTGKECGTVLRDVIRSMVKLRTPEE